MCQMYTFCRENFHNFQCVLKRVWLWHFFKCLRTSVLLKNGGPEVWNNLSVLLVSSIIGTTTKSLNSESSAFSIIPLIPEVSPVTTNLGTFWTIFFLIKDCLRCWLDLCLISLVPTGRMHVVHLLFIIIISLTCYMTLEYLLFSQISHLILVTSL